MKARGEILKRVQDDVDGALLAISLLDEGFAIYSPPWEGRTRPLED